jgi:hypothetical protein
MKHCKHEWEVTQTAPSPGSGRDVPAVRFCKKCRAFQYRVWKFNAATKQYQTYWKFLK